MSTFLKSKEDVKSILDNCHPNGWRLSWYRHGGSQVAHILIRDNGYWELDTMKLMKWTSGEKSLYQFITEEDLRP